MVLCQGIMFAFFLGLQLLLFSPPKQSTESQGKPAAFLLADLRPGSLCRGTSGST